MLHVVDAVGNTKAHFYEPADEADEEHESGSVHDKPASRVAVTHLIEEQADEEQAHREP